MLIAFNPLVVPIAYAESITTGDAGSSSELSTEANTNIDNASGTVTPGSGCNPPDVVVDCVSADSITNDNQADTSSSNTASAQTGQNDSSGSTGGVDLNTGKASASAQTSNQLNTNILKITEASESAVVEEATPSGKFSIINQNDARTQNEVSAVAGTGENSASYNAGDVSLNSGDALAVGNIFNLVNINVIGSNFQILLLNLADQQGDINLFKIWKEILESNPADHLTLAGDMPKNPFDLLIQNQNQADVYNNLTVTALTGKNEANNNGSVDLHTGDATAVANITNVVNVNITGSKFLFAIVNVLGSYKGNLILPRKEYFATPQSEGNNNRGIVINQNESLVENNVLASADSGGNEADENQGDLHLQTGDAEAVSRSLSFLNLNIFGNNWFKFLVNNLGTQTGQVNGWSSPEAQENPANDLTLYSTEVPSGASVESGGDDSQTKIENFNKAKIYNDIFAGAISGQNKANGNGPTSVSTGKSTALANLFNLAGLNVFDSNWFMGAINIPGDWQGNTIFAYPDVAIAISGPAGDVKPGDEVVYNIDLENKGYDDARDVVVSFDLPKGTKFSSDTFGVSPALSGNNLKWHIGNLIAGQSASYKIRVRIDPDLKPDNLLSFWDKLVPTAYAAEEGRREQIKAQVKVSTIDPESDSKNDSAMIATSVLFSTPAVASNNSEENKESTPAPTTIEISAKNNVNNFVYQGDTITFELQVKNTGNETAKNVTVSQDIYDGEPESTGSVDFPLGDIEPAKVVKITFGIQVTDLKQDSYHTVAKAYGDNISSNEAVTYFKVVQNALNLIPEVSAQENQSQTTEVKGIEACPVVLKAKKQWWPHALAAMFATLWFLEMSRRKQWDTMLINRLKRLKKNVRR